MACKKRDQVQPQEVNQKQRFSAEIWGHFCLSYPGRRKLHWHLVGRGWGYCQTSYNALDTPTTVNYLTPNANSTKTEKPWLKGRGHAHLAPSSVQLTGVWTVQLSVLAEPNWSTFLPLAPSPFPSISESLCPCTSRSWSPPCTPLCRSQASPPDILRNCMHPFSVLPTLSSDICSKIHLVTSLRLPGPTFSRFPSNQALTSPKNKPYQLGSKRFFVPQFAMWARFSQTRCHL